METLCQGETGKCCQSSPHPSICSTTQVQQQCDILSGTPSSAGRAFDSSKRVQATATMAHLFNIVFLDSFPCLSSFHLNMKE